MSLILMANEVLVSERRFREGTIAFDRTFALSNIILTADHTNRGSIFSLRMDEVRKGKHKVHTYFYSKIYLHF